jgi:hypothetical protein
MHLPEPHPFPFSTLVSEIEKGIVKIPQFQRDFVWSKAKSCKLMDSIVKGYPIGTFIFWKTNERLRSIRNIGGISLPEPPKGDFIQYVLDGQQRLTSLYATLKGLVIKREEIEEDFSTMYVDLCAKEDEEVVILDIEKKDMTKVIRLKDLLYGKLTIWSKYSEELQEKIDDYRTRIQSYNFSSILIKEAPLDVATEIFTRINVGGKPLTVFEIMVAKTYDSAKKFDLAEKYKALIDNLSDVGYETIAPATVLQTVSMLLMKECSKKQILNLKKDKFIDVWNAAIDAIESSVDYFRGFYRIPVSRLLPYNALIVPFAYFFFHHKDKPTSDKQKYLQDFFWRCSLSGRYSSGVESKLAQDIKRIEKILKGELPKYDFAVDTSSDFIQSNGWFSAGRSYVKAILCIYAYYQPKSFNDNSLVQIGNNWLKQANSKNYHHFFPKAYMEKEYSGNQHVNHVLNITIVDAFLNKREIGANAPSKYMKKFEKENPKLGSSMKSHLIDDLEKFGIWNNDYDTFFEKRAERISEELDKRIIPQDVDGKGQDVKFDDYEDNEEIVEVE